jgi:hypothetical protein
VAWRVAGVADPAAGHEGGEGEGQQLAVDHLERLDGLGKEDSQVVPVAGDERVELHQRAFADQKP